MIFKEENTQLKMAPNLGKVKKTFTQFALTYDST